MALPSIIQLPLFAAEKRCARCDQLQPLEAFAPRKQTKKGHDGRENICRSCRRQDARAWCDVNREKCQASSRWYAERHREEVNAKARAHAAAHREERRAYSLAYLAAHRAERNAYSLVYNRTHRERLIVYAKEWRQAHPDQHRATRTAYLQANATTIVRAARDYRLKNRSRITARLRTYRENNPATIRAIQHRRRARLLTAGGSFTSGDIQELFRSQEGRCAYCGVALGKYHIDHMTPLSRGGSNNPENLALACPSCNLHKMTQTADEFRALRAAAASQI